MNILSILILSAIGFSAYVVLKTWIKAWKDKVKWVRVLTKALFIVLSILTLFVLWLSYELHNYFLLSNTEVREDIV